MSQTFRTQHILSIREIDANPSLFKFHLEQLIAGFCHTTGTRPRYVVMTVVAEMPEEKKETT